MWQPEKRRVARSGPLLLWPYFFLVFEIIPIKRNLKNNVSINQEQECLPQAFI